ncbi:MAG TPA: putative Ig domain-containing protein [Terriglobales bacterium]|nr:putative Ig domain-containing protein [Terriglobales bacterium]
MAGSGTSLGRIVEFVATVFSTPRFKRTMRSFSSRVAVGLAATLPLALVLSGCGGGGYAGGGIASLSATSFVMDAGQSVNVTANLTGSFQVAWAFSDSSCSGSACGGLSSASGLTTTYTAPSGITSPIQVTLLASIPQTKSQETVDITVNPDPTITGAPPAGIVGSAYSTMIVSSGGTSPLKTVMASGTLPPGLSFNAATGEISGTPTATGTFPFMVQLTDTSAVPFTVTANKTITISNPVPPLTLTGGPQPIGQVGTPYTTSLVAAGGVTPYSWSITAGSLPAGLSISPSTGVISGTPTAQGTSNFTVQVKDSPGAAATAAVSITINSPLSLTNVLPNGTVGIAYSASITAAGGTTPYACSITGSLPAGLSLSGCIVSGTPTVAGSATVTVKVTDASSPSQAVSQVETIVISPATLTLGSPLPNGTVGVAYNANITASGGTTPYSCSITGALPAGLGIAGCTVSGTPTVAGSVTVLVKVTDAGTPSQNASANETINIAPAALSLTNILPNGTVGVPYSAPIGATGGITPYSCSITGALPAGLSLSACTVSGTPTTAGSSPITVTVTDSGSPAQNASQNETIVIAPATLTITSTLPNGTVGTAYSANITAADGTPPYTCSITGTLPAGLSLAGCTISGTPTAAGSSPVTVKVTDSGSPAQNATQTDTIVISPAVLAITNTLPNGTVGVAYTGSITATGGTTPYSCSITGALPAGLTLTGCTVSGTPTTAGSSPITVTVTDSGSPAQNASQNETIVINPAPLTITGTLPGGTVGSGYTGTITPSGGTGPYTCSITGTLPPGLILTGCTISGTPTTPGSSPITVTVTDSGSPTQTASQNDTIVISPAPLSLSTSNLPDGTVGVPYSAPIGVAGGTSPYSCSITSGTLPAGLSLSGCTVTGTPTTAGSSTVTVKVDDSGSPSQTTSGPETIVINPAALTLTNTLPNGTVGVAYSAPIDASGGTTPYTCSISSGSLPAGLTLTGCTVGGTPTTAGSSTVTVTVTDSSNPTKTISQSETITINPSGTLSLTATLPVAIVGVPYSYTLQATGGTSPYTYSVTAGSLPPGITLQSNGVISGTPTQPGASSFTATVTDSVSATASVPLVLLVQYPTTPYDGELTGPYAYLFQGYDDVLAGVLAYQTASIGSFTADGAGGINMGELDANHQSSHPTGTTVASQNFIGTYIVNADSRGFITITTLNPDGTTDQTFTYAISLKVPVSPATVSTQGTLIEYDNDQLVGTKGSGQLLAQTSAAFSAGLNGSYAFGLSGDTPCLISCTVGIASGPVATVGEFTTDGAGNLTTGTADANIASFNFANAPLSGSYQTADQNGRLQLEMTNTSISDGLYPTNFAVYIVDANHAFMMSTDKHSEFTLLAGTAQLQTLPSFSNASMNSAFIGYENAQSNPGLLGTTLQNVLNYSSSTIFRASGDGAGTCNTTNVDMGGLTSTIDGLTGLTNGDKNNLISALLGSYASTGTSSCTVSSNGRGTLNYPNHSGLVSFLLGLLGLPTGTPDPRIFYLVGPNQGYFLETGYAGLGQFEPQTGAPFSLATFNGEFVIGTIPASSLASVNSSGYVIADGAGNATYTLDENVGVGTLNVLKLGVIATTTYSLSDNNSNVTAASAGRYVLADGTTVIYAISPGRFVVVDMNPLATSPGVSLAH